MDRATRRPSPMLLEVALGTMEAPATNTGNEQPAKTSMLRPCVVRGLGASSMAVQRGIRRHIVKGRRTCFGEEGASKIDLVDNLVSCNRCGRQISSHHRCGTSIRHHPPQCRGRYGRGHLDKVLDPLILHVGEPQEAEAVLSAVLELPAVALAGWSTLRR
eukprot:scaffold1348_cov323-Prasinococcus_capsulatus_cf.AAC.7